MDLYDDLNLFYWRNGIPFDNLYLISSLGIRSGIGGLDDGTDLRGINVV